MKLFLSAVFIAFFAQTASADLYITDRTFGLGGVMVFDNNVNTTFNGGVHGDYTIGLYSPSSEFFAQGDMSVDVFQTPEYRLNSSLIAGYTMQKSKVGLYLGVMGIEGRNVIFQGGITGMYDITPNINIQAEAGVLTSGVDGVIFQNNIPFYQGKIGYQFNDTLSIFAKASHFGSGSIYHARGVIGMERDLANSPWEFTAAAGVQDYNGRLFPVLRGEMKYAFGGFAPDTIRPIAGKLFDKFEPLEYLYYRSGRLIRQIAP